MSNLYILVNGKPVPMPDDGTWIRWMKAHNVCIETTKVDNYLVRTLFTGWARDTGPPILYETMVFGLDDRTDQICRRYTTLGEAKCGHWESVDELRARTKT